MNRDATTSAAPAATAARKTAAEIIGGTSRSDQGFAQHESGRAALHRDLLGRVLLDLPFQDQLCAESTMQTRGLPTPERPRWAYRLAEVLRNPSGKYSRTARSVVFETSKTLYAETDPRADEGPGEMPLVEYLGYLEEVPILSDIARDLLPGLAVRTTRMH